MTSLIQIDGHSFDSTVEYFRFPGSHYKIQDMNELEKLQLLPRLVNANFEGTHLDDSGLVHVAKVSTLEQLDLQGTHISNDGLACLARLPRLRYLRLKENRQLTNYCIQHILRLAALEDLSVHETSIDLRGLNRLAGLSCLRDLVLDTANANDSLDGVLQLSARIPHCTILVKGRGEFRAGNFEGTWPPIR